MDTMDTHTMEHIQEKWCYALCNSAGAELDDFIMVQPSHLSRENDAGLWALLNCIPSHSQTLNPLLQQGQSFFKNYITVISQLRANQSSLEQVIGNRYYKLWCVHLSDIHSKPRGQALAMAFRNWAMAICPQKAQEGASVILQAEITAKTHTSMDRYAGPDARPVDFTGSFFQLADSLAKTSEKQIDFNSLPQDIQGKVTPVLPNMWGLWTGLAPDSRLSRIFAANPVSVTLKVEGFGQWPVTPGGWYNSSLLNQAYASKTSPPWKANPERNWGRAFGPDGILKKNLATVFFAHGVSLHMTCDFPYDDFDRVLITQYAGSGVWPLYVPDSQWAKNTIGFRDSAMDIVTVIEPHHPIALGAVVLGINRYIR